MHPRIAIATRSFISPIHVALFTVILAAAARAGEPVCLSVSGSPVICVDWDEATGPVHPDDFEVDFTDPASPDIELKTGSLTWQVSSFSGLTPADIGTITTTGSENYVVTIKGSGTNPGANNIATLNFSPAGNHYSSIGSGTKIAGDLTSDLTVVQDSNGDGGEVSIEIEGDASGNMTIPVVNSLKVGGNVSSTIDIVAVGPDGIVDIDGDVTATADITVDEISVEQQVDGDLLIGGDVIGRIEVGINGSANFRITGQLTGEVEVTQTLKSGRMFFDGGVSSTGTITVADMEGDNPRIFPGAFDGTLILSNGLPAGMVCIEQPLGSNAVINLTDSNVTGRLDIRGGGSGEIINGGAITTTTVNGNTLVGDVRLGVDSSVFSGEATFASVSANSLGIHLDNDADLNGTVTVTGNVDGDIRVNGSVGANGTVATGNVNGTITVGDSEDPGELAGDLDIGGTVDGDVNVFGAVSGTIVIVKELHGLIDISSNLSGDITINGDQTGDVDIRGNLSGNITVTENLSGDITARRGNVSGNIDVGKTLESTGRILVDDLTTGDIAIGENTESLSLILVADGVGAGASIVINESKGDHNADGQITIGPRSNLQSVTFDGTIFISDNVAGTNGGDLNGNITVTGCHTTAADLDICVCGNTNGTVTIDQSPFCGSQVSWSCVSGCN